MQSIHGKGLPRLGLLAAVLMLSACKIGGGGGGGSGGGSEPAQPVSYKATIERTTYGIPHITADDIGGAGYGHGYAIAEDNLCVLADAFVTFNGERSRYFGPQGVAAPMGTFGSPPNLEADFFFRFIVDDNQVEQFKAQQPEELMELTTGFAAGYSRYVEEIKDNKHVGRHNDCRNAEWLQTIDSDDVLRRLIALNLAASSANWVEEIASAQPPAAQPAMLRRSLQSPEPESLNIDPERFLLGREAGVGSNTYAFGKNATESGGGLLFANPHWYLLGVDRFYQLHMTVPGKLNVSGVSIMGAPMVLMGFNDNIAWAHTVSTARRFTLFQLQLVSGDPTSYVVDGQTHAMQAVELTVDVLLDDGQVVPQTRTLYRSSYGPMINLSGLGLPGWNSNAAFTLRDANLENTRAFQNFFAWGAAESLTDFYDITREYVGIPWVNTTAIGRNDERALYSDITVVPNVPTSMLEGCLVPGLGAAVMGLVPGLPLLDGSREVCNWLTDEDSVQSGAFGPGNLPSLFTEDYVANMNDSYWLSNPDQPLTGYAGIIGQEGTPQSLRTRMGHTMAQERLAGLDGLSGTQASSENVREIVLNSRVYSAERMKTAILAVVCDGSLSTDQQQACDLLAAWDNRGEIEARGAHIWSALWEKIRSNANLYATPFDAADPINTPDGLNTSSAVQDALRAAFSSAVSEIVGSGVALNARLGDLQSFLKPGTDIAQYGGAGREGYFTVLNNTYMHVVEFPGDEVNAYTLLSHSQSTDPDSPHYADYTQAYADKQWHRFPFTREQIEAARLSQIEISSE